MLPVPSAYLANFLDDRCRTAFSVSLFGWLNVIERGVLLLRPRV